MLEQRCRIPPSRAARIVDVMAELHRRRQRSNVFAGRHAFVTARDLFKWAGRLAAAESDAFDALAQEGYMLLGEGLRRAEEKACVHEVLRAVFKVSVDVGRLYAGGWGDDVAAMRAQSAKTAGKGQGVRAGGAGGGAGEADGAASFEGLVQTKSAKRLLRLVAR